ncbi:hypothetical protein PCANC_01382 [Puccinia coronata f. sp. avenae]|uniref:Uncharacterized protein n=1 Tax=Puccinia coronata f. sp. avenae TaxID=200324 RepID=A0A2N5W686_9BASI|nr:hypothetical protein PCANC_01382 [Puccinia coronata f. sp. avenae]
MTGLSPLIGHLTNAYSSRDAPQIGQPTDRTTSGHIQYRCLRPLLLIKTRLPQTISSSFLLVTIRDYETLVHPIDTSSPTISQPEPSSDGPGQHKRDKNPAPATLPATGLSSGA